jgi:hypothetical protein
MLNEGDLVNIIKGEVESNGYHFGINTAYVTRMVEKNPHTIRSAYDSPTVFGRWGDRDATYAYRIDGDEERYFWPDYMIEAVFTNREPDWEV